MGKLELRGRRAPLCRHVALVLVSILAIALFAAPSSAASPPVTATATVGATAARAADDRDFPALPRSCYRQVHSEICRVTRYSRRPWLVLWGDSHALQYLEPVRAIAQQRRVNLVVIYSGGCPLSLPFPASSGEPRMTCDQHNERAADYVGDLARSGRRLRVILGSYWHYYRRQHARLEQEQRSGVDSGMSPYERHIARLGVERSGALFQMVARAGIAADVIAQSGVVPVKAPACPAGETPYVCDLDRQRVLPRFADNRRWLRRLASPLGSGTRAIDPSPTYCDQTTCHGRVNGRDTFYDRGHLGMAFTRSMREYFRPSVLDLVSGS